MQVQHQNLIRALQYLQKVTDKRLEHHFSKKTFRKKTFELPAFELEEDEDCLFTQFVAFGEFSIEEFIVLMTALVPHIIPNFFERIISKYLEKDDNFPEFGGHRGGQTRYMMPTVGTALFILAGDDIHRRLELLDIFSIDHIFSEEKILLIEELVQQEPFLSRRIIIDDEYLELFIKGHISMPKMSIHFPAEQLNTEMDWEDLVLNEATENQLKEINLWLEYNEDLMNNWGLRKKVKPGYKALFYGPPGTGKTLAASLIGKQANRPVFRVDLSKVVSKYIGETEKNLANLFDKAENKDWILFFDEADACFGKRSSTKDAKDRYANQEVSYLLQRIESYNGLVIMATNFKNNMDEAFLRRFNSIIYFPKPKAKERLELWQKSIPTGVRLDAKINLSDLANKYDLTGAHIIGAVHHACLHSRAAEYDQINGDFLMQGIGRELAKEGKRL